MMQFVSFEEIGGLDDMPSPAHLVHDQATKWVNEHKAEVVHIAVAIEIDHDKKMEACTLSLFVKL